MMPVIPHFSNECLKNLKKKKIKWPKYDEKFLIEEKIKYCCSNKWKKKRN